MADKAQALYNFWSGFGIPAYDENTVPEDVQMPYITYSSASDMIDNVVPLSASIWYRSSGWEEISIKADQIARFLRDNFPVYPLDQGGYLWVTRGSPFQQRMSDPDDDMVRRIYINILVEYLTSY